MAKSTIAIVAATALSFFMTPGFAIDTTPKLNSNQDADALFRPQPGETAEQKYQRRIYQAEYLIKQMHAFEDNARKYHAQVDQSVREAEALRREAERLEKIAQADTFQAGAQSDVLKAKTQQDALQGTVQSNSLQTSGDNNTLKGQAQGDFLNNGSASTDALKGQAQSDMLHGSAQNDTLKGKADMSKLARPVIPLHIKLTPEQYKLAVQQYNGDITLFKAHAAAYNAHLMDFNQHVGECHVNDEAYQEAVRKYQLHLDEFHIPMAALKPPHVCPGMMVAAGDAARIVGAFVGDQLREANAMQRVTKQTLQLNLAEQAQTGLAKSAINASVRSQREAQLADEFGQLSEEYKLLGIEKDSLGGKVQASAASAGGAGHVSGTINPKH